MQNDELEGLLIRRSVRVARVADALDMEEARVRKLLKDGQLQGHRIGKRGIRIYVDSVEELQRRTALGIPPDPKPPRQGVKRGPSAEAYEAMRSLREMGVF